MTNVQGWKINLRPYKYDAYILKDGQEIKIVKDFDVVESLAGLCFNQGLKLDAEGMFRAKTIADKIRAAGNEVTLDEKEMEHLNDGYHVVRGLPEYFIECLERIRDAKKVELAEVSKE